MIQYTGRQESGFSEEIGEPVKCPNADLKKD